MHFESITKFLKHLEKKNHLKYISHQVSSNLEITEISSRFLKINGPALYFKNVLHNDVVSQIPVVTNLFAHKERVSMGLGLQDTSEIKELGKLLAFLRYPSPPSSFRDTISMIPLLKRALLVKPKLVKNAPSQEKVITNNININLLPIQKSWPDDISQLITWPLIVTKNLNNTDTNPTYNLGVYRLQPISKDKLIVRWLKMRGGSKHHHEWKNNKNYTRYMPIAAVIGASPALILSAVMPIPSNISEYNFASLIQNKSLELVKCKTIDLNVPADAEIIIEGVIDLEGENLPEGPFGDHTGYYNEVEYFPVLEITAITTKKNPIYLSTYTGKPPDEPSIIAEVLNDLFLPIIQSQFPEIIDFYLPKESCSYRFALISIKKRYPGQGIKVMMGILSFLEQFMYIKYIIVLDDDINIRDWHDVIWAISTRSDPVRDTHLINNTPIDYLDFASPKSGLGGKICIDATNKIGNETSRNWGKKISQEKETIKNIDKIWEELIQ
ncbi:UbiD family decarboxylase [Rickettsia endosymbiont of Cardiosporidium cionae]|uniref:UbiD family decarboxylase n=1 Tax=Rickettsia endosymbiont of Cardiosporidium cionae TaxID=2777155 RepID=UPI001893E6C9|nr:UbiD family decarboxylase [Rickettsia endosymbiont of Cardiosporidium cionae]KAF8818798.1 UbiD family decarboxylase [Rickettsia endosymbiont of Cardiosporidium cionae]